MKNDVYNNLCKQGYKFNAEMYKQFGETVQFGKVGKINGTFFKVGNLTLKEGDSWKEELNPETGKVTVTKLK